ncbi:S41 family peptidase [Shewanella sedimentimangrovi]|uniref:S41 family peptidase n=1 Tax=Shewanella sedimentimangrovi TaxID=2814293 RepID=A0ABX7QY46_9GAMM|nr:S41 family peptidase [Shewanella sedimentimangrovi]QSX36453.1 S41 family peptidase [Shewanella sedimentimangrovi]
MKALTALVLILLMHPAVAQEKVDNDRLLDLLRENISKHYVEEESIPEILKALEQTSLNATQPPEEIAKTLTSKLQHFDKHFAVKWQGADGSKAKDSKATENWFAKLNRKNSGFTRAEVLEGNIGYLDFFGFDLLNEKSTARAQHAMAFLSDADAIIFDLRNNGGGSPDMVRLISSSLFEGKVHLNSIYNKSTGNTVEYWTTPDENFSALTSVPVYVLTSSNTFSAAEEFAYNLQSRKRAIIVGEITKGGANPWQYFNLIDGFKVAIPTAKAINPITHSNWESVGVQPDVQTNQDDALDAAYKLALQQLQKQPLSAIQRTEIENKLHELSAP